MPVTAYQWIDLLWLPIALITARKGHRIMAVLFVLACLCTLRAQVGIMRDHDHGFLGLFPHGAFIRGLCVYSLGMGVFLGLAWASPGALKTIYAAAAILFYFMMFAVSMLVMLL